MSDSSRQVLCPYCGHLEPKGAEHCPACGGLFDDLSRKVSAEQIGPWHVRDISHPFIPGCRFEVLLKQIERGRVGPDTVIRGPTTGQFWQMARKVPGVAHRMGFCHACGESADPQDEFCGECGAPFPDRPVEEDGADDHPGRSEPVERGERAARPAGGRAGTVEAESARPSISTEGSSILSALREDEEAPQETGIPLTAISHPRRVPRAQPSAASKPARAARSAIAEPVPIETAGHTARRSRQTLRRWRSMSRPIAPRWLVWAMAATNLIMFILLIILLCR
jgi:hypothetical protein